MLKIIFCSGKQLLPWSTLPTSNQRWSPVSWFGFQVQVCPLQEAGLFSILTTSLFSPRFPYVNSIDNSTVGKQTDSCCLSPQHPGVYLIQLQWSHCGYAPTYSLTIYSRPALLPPPLHSFWYQLDHEKQDALVHQENIVQDITFPRNS